MKITVFTPTYNRGYIIKSLYESLKRQAFRDFEWIVINDGSTDDTDDIFDNEILPDDHFFNITYVRTMNGGKHRAVNKGIALSKGELFFIVDSDDYLTDDSLEIIDKVERTISPQEKHKFAGVCGLKAYNLKDITGTTYSGNGFLDITSLERSTYRIEGDKAEVFYTDILKKYPFPEFEGEKFLTECVVWDKIAFDGYKLRFFNDIVYICDYLPDGLTKNIDFYTAKSPQGHALYLYQSYKFGKTDKKNTWISFLGYYYKYRYKFSTAKMAKHLHQNSFFFVIKITLLRIKYKFIQLTQRKLK